MIEKFKKDLEYTGLENKFVQYLGISVLTSILLWYTLPLFSPIPIILVIGFPVYLAEAKRARIRKSIPDIAMSVAELWGLMPISEILKRQENPELVKTGKAIESGVPVSKALLDLEKKVPELEPVVRIIKSSYRTGHNASKLLTKLAEQYSSEQIIREETRANQLIESVTIGSAASIMVPFIIGSMVSMSRQLSSGFLGSVPEGIQNMAILGSQGYIGIYAVIAGIYLGLSSGSMKKGILYSGILLPIALSIYQLAITLSF